MLDIIDRITERAEDGPSGFVSDLVFGAVMGVVDAFWKAIAEKDAAEAAAVLSKATWNSPMGPLYVVDLPQKNWLEPPEPSEPPLQVHVCVLLHKEEGNPELLEEIWADTLFCLLEGSRRRARLSYCVTVAAYVSGRVRSGCDAADLEQVDELVQTMIPSRE